VPEDDGACDHLPGAGMPSLELPSTLGGEVELAELGSRGSVAVLFIYPRTGVRGETQIDGWDLIPGARGCTPQNCAFRDLQGEFSERGVGLLGLSAQSPEEQAEFAAREQITFPLLADPALQLAAALGMPTFEAGGMTLYKRATLVIRARAVEKVFYPVFPPDQNAATVLAWLDSGD
jgi:peroxiredoxin